MITSVDPDGSIKSLQRYAAPASVTQLGAAPYGPFLSYSGSNGLLTATAIAADGTATNLQ